MALVSGRLNASPKIHAVTGGDSLATSIVAGKIIDSRTGKGIDAAFVSLPQWQRSAKSDSEGHFTLRDVPHGHVVIKVDRVGYVSRMLSLTVPDNDSTLALNVDLSSFGRPRPACTALATDIPRKAVAAAKPYVFGRPRTVMGGSLVQLYAWTSPDARDSVVAAEGTLAGQQVDMVRLSRGKFIGLGAVPIDSEFAVTLSVVVTYASGARRSVDAEIPMIAAPKMKKTPPPKTPKNTVAPLDSATVARISAETDLAYAIAARSMGTPILWTKPFIKPRNSQITSLPSTRTLGVAFKGDDGDSVIAVNRGVVALVVDQYFAGTTLYIDHGAGLVSGYSHLGQVFVTQGDTVERGQVVGTIGHAGHVAHPQFSWSMHLDSTAVNPLSALELTPIPAIPKVILCRPE